MIILGTGFDIERDGQLRRIARGGRPGARRRVGGETGIQAHRGTMIAGYPNLFFLLGPNTGLGHNSVVFMIECQIRLALQAIERVRAADAMPPSRPAPSRRRATTSGSRTSLRDAVWSRSCKSWYVDAHGRNITLWPHETWRFRNETATLKEAEYELVAAGGRNGSGDPDAVTASELIEA